MEGSGLTISNNSQEFANLHLVILVHGLNGNDKELGYLEESITRQASKQEGQRLRVILHSVKCNLGRTHDGVANGGDRLLQEVEDQIQANVKGDAPLFLSFIGHSLGGIYARYASAHLDFSSRRNVVPFIFCTNLTPHLGTANNTYVPLFNWTETIIANVLGSTGRDLFHRTSLLHEMGTSNKFLAPLRRFRKRIALANAFGTDFQVPPSTAAFLSQDSYYRHYRLPNKNHYLLSVETKTTDDHDKGDVSQCLDALGWTKIFLDARDEIPLPRIPLIFGQDIVVPTGKSLWSSQELFEFMHRIGKSWKVPLGHMVACANSRDGFNRWMNSNGRRFMDQLAMDIVEEMVESLNHNPQECGIES